MAQNRNARYPRLGGERLASPYLGYAHTLPKDDKRHRRYAGQRRRRGFDDTDLWSLDHTLARWMAPRLKAFRKLVHGYPADLTPEAWDAELAKMQRAFELLADDRTCDMDEASRKEVENGLDSFRAWFHHLWD